MDFLCDLAGSGDYSMTPLGIYNMFRTDSLIDDQPIYYNLVIQYNVTNVLSNEMVFIIK